MIGFLAKGTKENIHIDFVDRSDTVTNLGGSSPTFDVMNDANTLVVTAAAATASGMRITVLLDTTISGGLPVGEYRLFVKFTVSAQVIRKGPYYFTITES
jgi:hypothetical protein